MNIIRLNSIGEPFAKSGQATPPSGGGTEGGSNVVYLNVELAVSEMGDYFASAIKMFPGILAIKVVGDDMTSIGPVHAVKDSSLNKTKAAAILPNFIGFVEHNNGVNSDITIEEFKAMGATEITEEQFYTL